MDDLSSVDDDQWTVDFSPEYRSPQRPRLFEDSDWVSEEPETRKLYFVSYRWWMDAKKDSDGVGGVLYTVTSNEDADTQFLLVLREEEASGTDNDLAEGFSGREYALLSEAMWLQTLKRHNDFNLALKDSRNTLGSEDNLHDVFPLQIRLSVSWNTSSLVVRVNQKDNVVDFYERARSILCLGSELRRIWDFSGETEHFFMDERINLPNDFLGNPYEEIPIELRVQTIINSTIGKVTGKEENAERQQMKDSPLLKNGGTDNANLAETYSTVSNDDCRSAGLLGLVGLQNLGNTCFMNSAIQCLAHTPKVIDYFLGDYEKEINYENPLGMKGELALAFGGLLRKLWSPGSTFVAPRRFKLKLANFAPQFGGYNQHDSQEFLALMLDGLHEDLNRVKCKPYIETKDADGRPHDEVAKEHWQNHLARNDSVFVDWCQGQYRSTLVCPSCSRPSVTFDPFMYLSLPLPNTTMRNMTLGVFCAEGTAKPSTFTILVPKSGVLKDLINALSTACSLRDDETFLVAEIYKNRIFRFIEDPHDSLEFIRNEDTLVAYRLLKENNKSPLFVFIHQQLEMHPGFGSILSTRTAFGIPFVARLSDIVKGCDVHKEFLKLLKPLLLSFDDPPSNSEDGSKISAIKDFDMHKVHALASQGLDTDVSSDCRVGSVSDFATGFTFYVAYMKGDNEGTLIEMNEPVISRLTQRLDVFVIWSDKMTKKYDTSLLSSLPEVYNPLLLSMPQDSLSVYKCLEAFSTKEPLGPEDMWYCPSCKNHQQASKKLDLWRLPEILIIHLKRFSYDQYMENKLETLVDFPIRDLDFSTYIFPKCTQSSNSRYMLYAISNHYGEMGSGHYTAFVLHGEKWYEFNDDRVFPIKEEMIKTSAAYVLFYRRIPDE